MIVERWQVEGLDYVVFVEALAERIWSMMGWWVQKR
jgi:hypothetical protein